MVTYKRLPGKNRAHETEVLPGEGKRKDCLANSLRVLESYYKEPAGYNYTKGKQIAGLSDAIYSKNLGIFRAMELIEKVGYSKQGIIRITPIGIYHYDRWRAGSGGWPNSKDSPPHFRVHNVLTWIWVLVRNPKYVQKVIERLSGQYVPSGRMPVRFTNIPLALLPYLSSKMDITFKKLKRSGGGVVVQVASQVDATSAEDFLAKADVIAAQTTNQLGRLLGSHAVQLAKSEGISRNVPEVAVSVPFLRQVIAGDIPLGIKAKRGNLSVWADRSEGPYEVEAAPASYSLDGLKEAFLFTANAETVARIAAMDGRKLSLDEFFTKAYEESKKDYWSNNGVAS